MLRLFGEAPGLDEARVGSDFGSERGRSSSWTPDSLEGSAVLFSSDAKAEGSAFGSFAVEISQRCDEACLSGEATYSGEGPFWGNFSVEECCFVSQRFTSAAMRCLPSKGWLCLLCGFACSGAPGPRTEEGDALLQVTLALKGEASVALHELNFESNGPVCVGEGAARRVGVPGPARGLGELPMPHLRAVLELAAVETFDLELVVVTRDLHDLKDSAPLLTDPEVELQGDEHSESVRGCLGGVLAECESSSMRPTLLSSRRQSIVSICGVDFEWQGR